MSGDAFEQHQRQEHHDRRNRRTNHRGHQLADAAINRIAPAFRRATSHVPLDVFDHHHGIVNYQTNGHRDAAQAHQVESLPEQAHEKESDDDGQRNRGRGDNRDANMAEKCEQDDHRQQSANQNRIAYVGDRVADKRRLIVNALDLYAARQRRLQIRDGLIDFVGDVYGVAADLARHADQRRRHPVAGEHAGAIFRAVLHFSHVADMNRRAIGAVVFRLPIFGGTRRRDDDLPHVAKRQSFAGGQHVVLLVIAADASDRSYRTGLCDRVFDLADREMIRRQTLGRDDYFDLAHVTAFDPRLGHAVQSRQPRPNRIRRQFAQNCRRRARDVIADNWKDRRRQSLHVNGDSGRQFGLHLSYFFLC